MNITELSSEQKRCLGVLEDTLEFYKADPVGRRAVRTLKSGSTQCMYFLCDTETKETKKCSVGRLMSDETLRQIIQLNLEFDPLSEIWDEIDAPELKSLPYDFFYDLQEFHDCEDNWSTGLNSITEAGFGKYEVIKERIINNKYRDNE